VVKLHVAAWVTDFADPPSEFRQYLTTGDEIAFN